MCECIEAMDRLLAASGMKLEVAWLLDRRTGRDLARVAIRAEKSASGRKRTSYRVLLPDYCPLCGERYPGEGEA